MNYLHIIPIYVAHLRVIKPQIKNEYHLENALEFLCEHYLTRDELLDLLPKILENDPAAFSYRFYSTASLEKMLRELAYLYLSKLFETMKESA